MSYHKFACSSKCLEAKLVKLTGDILCYLLNIHTKFSSNPKKRRQMVELIIDMQQANVIGFTFSIKRNKPQKVTFCNFCLKSAH